ALLPEHADSLGPQAWDAEHVDEPLGHAGGQFVVVGAGAGFEPVADDLGAGSADAVALLDGLASAVAVDGANVLWHVFQDVLDLEERDRLERVLPLEVENARHAREETGKGLVVSAGGHAGMLAPVARSMAIAKALFAPSRLRDLWLC